MHNRLRLKLLKLLFATVSVTIANLSTNIAQAHPIDRPFAPVIDRLIEKGITQIGDLSLNSVQHSNAKVIVSRYWWSSDDLTKYEGWNVNAGGNAFAWISPEVVQDIETDPVSLRGLFNHELLGALGIPDNGYELTAPMLLLEMGAVSLEQDPELFTKFRNLKIKSEVLKGTEAFQSSGGGITGVGGGGHRATLSAKLFSIIVARWYKGTPKYNAMYHRIIQRLLEIKIIPIDDASKASFSKVVNCVSEKNISGDLVIGLDTACWQEIYQKDLFCREQKRYGVQGGGLMEMDAMACISKIEPDNGGLSHIKIGAEIVNRVLSSDFTIYKNKEH